MFRPFYFSGTLLVPVPDLPAPVRMMNGRKRRRSGFDSDLETAGELPILSLRGMNPSTYARGLFLSRLKKENSLLERGH